MKIKFYAHASFLLEGDDLRIVTDPYQPGEASGFDPIEEPADLVIMSSTTDHFHSDPSHVQGDPKVLDALQVPSDGVEVEGLSVQAFPTRERLQWRVLRHGYLPRKNAMYAFTLDGLRVLHTGDVGRPFKRKVLRELRGRVDVMMALAGAVHNIEHEDMMRAIDQIGPRVVVPMHYYSEKGVLQVRRVEEFAANFPDERVVWVDGPEVELTPETLPEETHLYVLRQSR